MAQKVGDALDNGETEAKALGALARRIVDLMELVKNRLKLLFWNADPGIPDLDAQFVAAPPARNRDLARLACSACRLAASNATAVCLRSVTSSIARRTLRVVGGSSRISSALTSSDRMPRGDNSTSIS